VTRKPTFIQSAYVKAIRAARAAGIESFDILPSPTGQPIIRVRPAGSTDTPQDVLDEIQEWAREG